MKITKPLLEVLKQFNSNWEKYQKRLCFDLLEEEIRNIEAHPLSGELINLINGKGGSFPFFTDRHVIWCTLAPQPLLLQKQIEKLQAWILPSYGWQESGDGYKIPDTSRDTFQRVISEISPTNYFRWRCSIEQYSIVEHKLATFYQLEERRPERNRLRRPSLYELRTQFQSALLLGDRDLAEKAIELIDTYELDKALNTQLMRIRLWHHFREFENIRNCRNLPYLQTQPYLPNIINECIREALGEFQPEPVFIGEPEVIPIDIKDEWEQWFSLLIDQNDIESARNWLEEKDAIFVEQLNQNQIEAYSERWDSLFVSNELKQQNRQLINEALVTFLGDFVREPDFPRRDFAELYSSLLRLWGEMNAGIGGGREEGHVLLELANALFELNHNIDEAKSIIEAWWKARPVPSQLPFALDAIELLAYQHPDSGAAGNLWIDAADLAKEELAAIAGIREGPMAQHRIYNRSRRGDDSRILPY